MRNPARLEVASSRPWKAAIVSGLPSRSVAVVTPSFAERRTRFRASLSHVAMSSSPPSSRSTSRVVRAWRSCRAGRSPRAMSRSATSPGPGGADARGSILATIARSARACSRRPLEERVEHSIRVRCVPFPERPVRGVRHGPAKPGVPDQQLCETPDGATLPGHEQADGPLPAVAFASPHAQVCSGSASGRAATNESHAARSPGPARRTSISGAPRGPSWRGRRVPRLPRPMAPVRPGR